MDFKKLDIGTIPEIRKFLKYVNVNTCDFTVGGMYMWRKYFDMQYAIQNGACYIRLFDSDGKEYYNLPMSEDIEGALVSLVNGLRKSRNAIRFCTVPEAFVTLFERNFSLKSIQEQPDYFDYLYTTEDLVNLRGKKYNSQRNLISQFERNTDHWSMEEISREDIPAIRKFFLENSAGQQDDPIGREEQEMTLEVLDNFDIYGMIGGMLIANGSIVGFSLGEILNDTFFVHIEKANRAVKGAHQMLARQMAMHFADGKTSFINREEDMGNPWLKKAKEAYHPVEKLKKFAIEVC